MDGHPGAQPTEAEEIREHDRLLAVRLSNSKAPAQAAELLQLAAIYAALPEDRRQHWFGRLGAHGVSTTLLDEIAERSGQLIRFPDRRRGDRLVAEHESKRHKRVVAASRRRWTDDEPA